MSAGLRSAPLPAAAPARVLALGAFLKNTACLIEPSGRHHGDGPRVLWSALHDDLSTPAACAALEVSVQALVAAAGGPIAAVAHDLHPDFHSTRLALDWAQRLGVPAIAVQHHHAHIAVVQAELGIAGDEPLIGLALDGVGLGIDGLAWGGELLRVQGPHFERLDHLPELALPGGDLAAREPWRMAAAVLWALGRGDEIEPRFAPVVGQALASGLHQLLQRDLRCPRTTSAGRWFDAAAGVLGLSVRQGQEAEAAIALEQAATAWLQRNRLPAPARPPSLDLRPVLATLLALPPEQAGHGAALFHAALAQGLVAVADRAAAYSGARRVVLGGGCFFNRLLSQQVADGLAARQLQMLRPGSVGCGDAGLALGQAWAAALQVAEPAAGQNLRDERRAAPKPARQPARRVASRTREAGCPRSLMEV